MMTFSLLYIFTSMLNPSFTSQDHLGSEGDVYVLSDCSEASAWYIINDGVMGGRSRSRVKQLTVSTFTFTGEISLENNGGFASTRKGISSQPSKPFSLLSLRVKGDGKVYQARLAMDGQYRRASYAASFETVKDEWIEVELALIDFNPQFRGRTLSGMPTLDPTKIAELGILIADKQQGSFRLELDSILLK